LQLAVGIGWKAGTGLKPLSAITERAGRASAGQNARLDDVTAGLVVRDGTTARDR
jgi:hypothetical protein